MTALSLAVLAVAASPARAQIARLAVLPAIPSAVVLAPAAPAAAPLAFAIAGLPAPTLAAPAPLAAAAAFSVASAPSAAPAAAPAESAPSGPGAAASAAGAAPALQESSPWTALEARAADARGFWDGADGARTPSEPEGLARALVSGRASPAFVARVRAHVAGSFPPQVLRGLLQAGYRVEANARVRQGRADLDAENDFTGGYHAHGPAEKIVVIGETLKISGTGRWQKSRFWENAVDHEIGLALDRVLGEAAAAADADPRQAEWYRDRGLSESPGFREAWGKDFAAMPEELKKETDPDGLSNGFAYFLRPDEDGWYQRARQVTFAEGLDVLLRGPRSTFNHEDFTLYFPRALAEIRRELAARYGWSLPQPALPPAPVAEPRSPWDDVAPPGLVKALVSGRASRDFVAKVRAQVALFPPAVLRDLLKAGYRVEANARARQGRQSVSEDNDYTGGFHSHGSRGNYIVIAETIRVVGTNEWVPSVVWENAVNHEIGHALAYVHGEAEAGRLKDAGSAQARWYRKKGLSESPRFREEWRKDFEAMPQELKKATLADGASKNPFFYFVHPDANGWYQRARQETWGEALDVLLRGPRSAYNHENFRRHFRRALAEVRRELEARYGRVFDWDSSILAP